MELHVVIEGRQDLSGQVLRQLRAAILDGRLAPGEQVPPTRLLAQQLGVSRKTIAEAYARLKLEQLLVGQAGSGTFVSPPEQRPQPARLLQAEDLAAAGAIAHWQKQQFPAVMTEQLPAEHSPYSFRGGMPALRQFPQDVWRQCVLYGLRQSSQGPAVFAPTEGLPELREAIARHVAFTRGVRCSAADILVTNGAQQALDLIARVLVEPGCKVAMEDPGYPPARMLFASQGAQVSGIALDAEGLRVDLIPDDTRLIYVTPAHQFPLGMTMSIARRRALLARARELGAIVIEDDYDSAFRYAGQSADALQSMDHAGLVAFVGTFSKIMQPGLRVGYVIAPPAIRQALSMAKKLSDWHTPTMTQWALARFMDDGHLHKHIRRCHTVYAARRDKLLAVLQGGLAPWLQALPASVGFHLSAMLRPVDQAAPLDLALLIRLAHRAEVALFSLDEFYYQVPRQAGLLFGFGAIESLDIEIALGRVQTILQEMST